MAKTKIIILLLILASLTIENADNSTKKLEFSPADLNGFISEFLHGAHISLVSESTIPCKNSFNQFLIDSAESIDEIMSDKVWEGTLSLTDALAGAAFVGRNCTNSVDELSEEFYNYRNSFDSFEAWIVEIEENVKKNMLILAALSAELVDEWQQEDRDYPLIGGILGRMAYNTLQSGKKTEKLKYLRNNPLAPAPMNEYVWMVFESAFEFFTNAQMVEEPLIANCHNALMNMLLFQMDAYRNIQKDVIQEGILLSLDSFVFLRPLVEQCTNTGLKIGETFDLVYNRIANNPAVVRKNFEERLFQVLSGSAATYAQVYHRDIISLNRVLGGLVYNTLVRKNGS